MDWYTVYGIDDEDAYRLGEIEDLRIHEPIIWALIQGKQTSLAISHLIAWPHDYTLGRLREYKQEGRVWDHEGRRSMIWTFTEDQTTDLELKDWIQLQRRAGGLFHRNEQQQE